MLKNVGICRNAFEEYLNPETSTNLAAILLHASCQFVDCLTLRPRKQVGYVPMKTGRAFSGLYPKRWNSSLYKNVLSASQETLCLCFSKTIWSMLTVAKFTAIPIFYRHWGLLASWKIFKSSLNMRKNTYLVIHGQHLLRPVPKSKTRSTVLSV